MKIIHLSDLHIGKRVNEFNLLEDQVYILDRILQVIDDEKPKTVIIAGDVYDKAVPSAEAVEVFDDFLCRLAERGLQVFVISGNHDSPERIAFASRLIAASGIHLSPVYNGKIEPVTLSDEFGPVKFWMLPFVRPANVRRFFPDEEINSYTDAVRTAIDHISFDRSERNVLITHQLVTGAKRSESEDISVGGTDNVDAFVFDGFSYVALGHIHSPQFAGSKRMYYCGTPLKYAISETDPKSVAVVTIDEKGDPHVKTVPLNPLRDMREIRGTYLELTARSYYERQNVQDYLYVTLTDEDDIPDAINRLRVIYPNIIKLGYDNTRTRTMAEISGVLAPETKSPLEILSSFYELQNGQPMNAEQTQFAKELIESIWEDKQ